MKYKIINHDEISKTISLIADEIILNLKNSDSVSFICPWYSKLDLMYKALFSWNKNFSKEEEKLINKNSNRSQRKKISKHYSQINIVNMYDFVGSDNLELLDISIFNKFSEILDPKINFCSFRLKDQTSINKELLITPSDFDKTIKTFTNGLINFSIVYIDKNGNIPFIENDVENIGTNLTSVEEKEIRLLNKKINITNYPEQSINCGNRCLTKSHKIIAIIEEEAVKFLTNDGFEKNISSSIKTLRNHDNVIYIVKSWDDENI